MPCICTQDRHKSKERDIFTERAITGLARNLALEKFPGIHKEDLKAIEERGPNWPCLVVRLMVILNITIEPSSNNRWKQKHRPTSQHWTELPRSLEEGKE